MSGAGPRVMIWVQHLLGIGHLRRAARLASTLQSDGMSVTLVSGGPPIPALEVGAASFVQLPPVRVSDRSFRELLHPDGRPVDQAFKDARRDRLLALDAELHPDILVTELYPFGRRQMRFEVEPLVAAAKARGAMVASSVRDILVKPDKPSRIDEMLERANRWFDLVLVHGDPDLVSLEQTFPKLMEMRPPMAYTGYVVAPAPAPGGPGSPGHGEVLVSAGGGAVSEALVEAALAARALSPLARAPWRVLIGPNVAEPAFVAFRDGAPEGVVVERARGDFTALLANCRLSISQGGYNTVMEILAARARAVCVPYAGGYETEQTLRCRLLAERGMIRVVEEDQLSPARLAQAIAAALDTEPAAVDVDLGGLGASARLLRAAFEDHGAAGASSES